MYNKKPLKSTQDEIVKVPPHNMEAEKAVLGSLLIDKDSIIKIADSLSADDFYSDKHRMIYETIQDIYAKREPIDVIAMANRLTDKEQLDIIGGRAYLISLTNVVPTASNIENYASIVQKKATLRRLIQAAHGILALGYEETDEVETLLDNAEQELFKVSQKYLRQNFVPLNTVLTEAFDRIDEIHKEAGKLRGVPTGFKDLDNKLGGLQKSDLVILAARPSLGKTSLALDIARHVAVREKIPVGLFSLEMSKDQLVDRLLCAEAKVDLWKMRTGKLSDSPEQDDFPRIGQAMGILSEAPIFIDDTANLGVMEIRTKARRLQMEHGLGLLVIDYLQLMEGRASTENRVQEIAEISRALKGIARELSIPVLALSQLSRAVEAQNVPIPKLSHLRESGSIEQDADVVMFIYREDYYDRNTERKGIADIIIAKHRNGPTGQIEMFFDMEKASFRNLEKHLEGVPDMAEGPPPEATPF
ncbi:replicative DNA helicase [Patescibacteria group bacterium]|nr:replicative DNA helicase [Patescibacteria group bacterium]MBU1673672.1 replicative DNA helicase [Patescibacteria group bacterium]MBU1963840.1 replicative DNA helicase [Patescibacteria group bacterium]